MSHQFFFTVLLTILSHFQQYTLTGLRITHSSFHYSSPKVTVSSFSLFASSSSLSFSSSSLSFLLSSSIMPLNAFSFSNRLPSVPHPHVHSSLFIVPLTLKLNAIASFNTFNEGTSIHNTTHFFQLSIVTSRAKRKHLILALNSRNSSTFCKMKRPYLPSSPSKEPSPIATVCKWGRSAKKN